MRIVKLKKEIIADSVSTESRAASFLEVEEKPLPSPVGKPSPIKKYGVWLAKIDLKTPLTARGRRTYEWFVAGYLYYYEKEVRNNSRDYAVFFNWGKANKSVEILITPPALQPLSDDGTAFATGKTDPPTPPPPPPPPME